jgi:hypothetical protein
MHTFNGRPRTPLPNIRTKCAAWEGVTSADERLSSGCALILCDAPQCCSLSLGGAGRGQCTRKRAAPRMPPVCHAAGRRSRRRVAWRWPVGYRALRCSAGEAGRGGAYWSPAWRAGSLRGPRRGQTRGVREPRSPPRPARLSARTPTNFYSRAAEMKIKYS